MISGVNISTSDLLIQKELVKSSILPDFKPGQMLNARVLAKVPSGGAKLLVNGQTLFVKTNLMLNPGEDIQLKVMDTKGEIHLKLMDTGLTRSAGQLPRLFEFVMKTDPVQKLFQSLSQSNEPALGKLVEAMSLKSSQRDETFVPRLLETGGLLLEKKQAALLENKGAQILNQQFSNLLKSDLKGILLSQLAMGGAESDGAKAGVAASLEIVENLQLLNSQGSDSGRFFLPFPIFGESGFNLGQLLIDTGDSGRESDKDKIIRVSFLLDMTRLGPVRADFSFLNQAVTGRFLVRTEEIRSYILSKISELKERLKKIEFHLQHLECRVADTEKLDSGVFMKTILDKQADQVLNIVV